MKIREVALGIAAMVAMFFALLLVSLILFVSDDSDGGGGLLYGGANLSAAVLAHRSTVERYAAQYDISEYVNVLLAISRTSCKP